MELKELLSRLPEGSVATRKLRDPEVNIDNICFLTPATGLPHPNVLYFSDDVHLPEGPIEDIFNVVLFGCQKVPRAILENPSCNVVLLRWSSTPLLATTKSRGSSSRTSR